MTLPVLSRKLFDKQWLLFTGGCVVFLLYNSIIYLIPRLPTTTSDVKELVRKETFVSNICKLAYNLDMESESYTSYQLNLDWSNVDHVTKKLCRRSQFPDNGVERQKTNNNNIDTSVILTFKVARSGSTFFTKVMMEALKTMKREANLYWEPYCDKNCYNRKSSDLIESELSTILSSNCADITQDDELCAIHGHVTKGKCCPVRKCSSRNFHRNAMSVVSLNPRFSDTVRWDKILTPSFPPTFTTRVFNLRRTNLVKMAYSMYHHGGCPVKNGSLNVNQKCMPNGEIFSFGCLLQCVQHYGE